MEIVRQSGWIFYVGNFVEYDDDKVGKWMYYFDDFEFVEKICKDAIDRNIIEQVKHSDSATGVACFYLNCDDIETHKKVLLFFIENNLIKKTKIGRLYNISFKLNSQTKAGQYGDKYTSDIKLSNFIDLDTGKWIM